MRPRRIFKGWWRYRSKKPLESLIRSAGAWPIATTLAPESADEEDDWLERPAPDLLPCLSPGDPRYDFALASSQKRAHELAELSEGVAHLSGLLAALTDEYDEIRVIARLIPQNVSRALSSGPNDRRTVEDQIDWSVYRARSGGAKGSRTADLLNAIQALSQLSYGPSRDSKPASASLQSVFSHPARDHQRLTQSR